MTPTPWQERFWRYVIPGALDECWEWQGGRTEHGYGRLNSGGKNGSQLKAHRASYEIHHGVEPDDHDVCHTCDNPPCVNPAHLFLGDAKANAQDMARKGRAGPQNGGSDTIRRLTDAQVRELRTRLATGADCDALAAEYGIARGYAYSIALGQRRASAGGPISHRR